ncbi:unnamed protein product [Rotaria sordida]|uniref:G-protein coupled receptors family 1 profile domain-containing protein n=1 Tax=Rotaria sordida TaxID=392033 RepID=A0A814T8V3_9BILA|nr:unnamed protein product [Rotaria sordida]CAF3768610.1 unnamed protein product [Rotaria sordida]
MSTTVATIQIVTNEMNYYGPIMILIFGIFGCICNFITFTATQLRKNSCAFYFLCATIFDLLSIIFGVTTRFANDHLGSTLLHTNRVYCKLRAYLVSAIPLVSMYLILLSSIDRYMSSSVSVRFRSFSQKKIAYRATVIAIVISFLSCSHILILYDLRPVCATMPGPYTIFDSMFVVFWSGMIPHVLMLIFGFLTIMNTRRKNRRIQIRLQTTNLIVYNQTQNLERKTDKQLIIMMLGQIGLSSLLIMTRMIYYAYYILKLRATGYEKLVDSFLTSFTILVYYTNFAKSFYIYTLSSHLFRSIFIHRIKLVIRKILGQYGQSIFNDNNIQTVTAIVPSRTRNLV